MLPLRHLHQVAGVVVAKSDGHSLTGGSVQLLYADTGLTYREQIIPIEISGNVTDLTVSVDAK